MVQHYEVAPKGFRPVFNSIEFWQCTPMFDEYPAKDVAYVYATWSYGVSRNLFKLSQTWGDETPAIRELATHMWNSGYAMLKVSEDANPPIYHQREITDKLNKGWFASVLDDREYVVKSLREMPYEQYLQTVHWKYVRFSKIVLSGAMCASAECREKPAMWDDLINLHIHHKTYENRGRENPDDLVQLCAECHRQEHAKLAAQSPVKSGEIEF